MANKSIKSLNLEIINTCNLNCIMCDIWKNKKANFLKLDSINKILDSKYIEKNTNITITWWEPLLHKDINSIFKEINSRWYTVNTLSTNWTLYKNLDNLLKFCLKNNIVLPNIHISIDWLKNCHDLQRQKEWSFEKSLSTIIKLKKQFRNIDIKIKYTITNKNIEDIIPCFLLSKKLWVNIVFKTVENDNFYTNKIENAILLTENEKLKTIKELEKIYFNENLYINNLIYYLKNQKLNFKCSAPKNNLFIMADSKVFCCTKYSPIWNIQEEILDSIINNKLHINIIKKTKNCNNCFSLHGSYNSLKK